MQRISLNVPRDVSYSRILRSAHDTMQLIWHSATLLI